jgi:hypothetical protein
MTKPRNLNPVRRNRIYDRVVKRARHNSYPVKQPHHTGKRLTRPPTVVLVNLTKPLVA